MGKTKKGKCSNPFDLANHYACDLRSVTAQRVSQYGDIFTKLQVGQLMCPKCRLRMDKIKPVEHNESDSDSDSNSEDYEPLPDMDGIAQKVQEINTEILEPLDISPLRAVRIKDTIIQAKAKWKHLQIIMHEKFSFLNETSMASVGLSPIPSVDGCKSCTKLVTDLKKRYMESTEKSDKYKILSCTPISYGKIQVFIFRWVFVIIYFQELNYFKKSLAVRNI